MIPQQCKDCIERNKNILNKGYNDLTPNPTPHFFNGNTQSKTPSNVPLVNETEMMNEDDFVKAPGSPTMLGIEYTQGYLRTLIGKKILVTFIIGTNSLVDRSGILEDVGISYIVLRETETKDLMLCDIYSITFVSIYK